jgi:hypothetical protein
MAGFGGLEHFRELLFSLADPFRNDAREIDLIHLELKLARDQTGDHRLACTRGPRKQGCDASASCELLSKAPAIENRVSVPHTADECDDIVEWKSTQRRSKSTPL